MTKITFIGGGSGLASVLLGIVSAKKLEVTALVSVFDSGGSSGELRRVNHIPAVGDLRRVCSAVASKKSITQLLETRLENGHALGNLMLAFWVRQLGLAKAVQNLEQLAATKCRILPSSLESADLVIQLANGKKLVGEHWLDTPPSRQAAMKVMSLALQPQPKANPAALEVIAKSDLLIAGPGSVLGSLLPHFAMPDFVTAWEKSRARKALVVPCQSEWGYHGQTATEIAARFPVRFDQIWEARRNKKWSARQILDRIQS